MLYENSGDIEPINDMTHERGSKCRGVKLGLGHESQVRERASSCDRQEALGTTTQGVK